MVLPPSSLATLFLPPIWSEPLLWLPMNNVPLVDRTTIWSTTMQLIHPSSLRDTMVDTIIVKRFGIYRLLQLSTKQPTRLILRVPMSLASVIMAFRFLSYLYSNLCSVTNTPDKQDSHHILVASFLLFDNVYSSGAGWPCNPWCASRHVGSFFWYEFHFHRVGGQLWHTQHHIPGRRTPTQLRTRYRWFGKFL